MLTQGSILYGIRSKKYSSCRCYGIIISARCDVAYCKVPKFYFLVAVDAKEWFSTEVGYREAYTEKVKLLRKQLDDLSDVHQLNADTLLSFTEIELDKVINKIIPKPTDRTKIRECISRFRLFSSPNMDDEKRKQAIRSDIKPAIHFLDKVGKGEIVHYYFLPQNSYCSNGDKCSGLIVDLQEIEVLPIEDAERIQSPGIDYMLLPTMNSDEQKRLKEHYWLESEDDYVIEYETINSPWIEHLMQRFSHGFIRIGVDGATNDDYLRLANDI